MRIAYADPPYPGNGHRYPEKKEVNHRLLIAHLQEFDGWALSTGSNNLHDVMPLCPRKARVAAWVKPFSSCRPNIDPRYAWEPVVFVPCRKGTPPFGQWPAFDWHMSAHTKHQQILGAKTLEFAMWVFDLLRAGPNDDFVDLFPGSGAVTRAWDAWKRQTVLPLGI